MVVAVLFGLRAADWPGQPKPSAAFDTLRLVERGVTFTEAKERLMTISSPSVASPDQSLERQGLAKTEKNRSGVPGVALAYRVRLKNMEFCDCLMSWRVLDERRLESPFGSGWFPARDVTTLQSDASFSGVLWVPMPHAPGRYVVRVGIRVPTGTIWNGPHGLWAERATAGSILSAPFLVTK
jgi:hypothetical protein